MPKKRTCTTCTEIGCGKPVYRRTLCKIHYLVPEILGTCTIDGCSSTRFAKGMCGMHWQRVKHGIPLDKPPRAGSRTRIRRAPGYTYVDANGYRCVRGEGCRNIRQFEHRIVMARKLGRELLPGENVHHIDGDRLNNAPENLELWTTNQPSGQRVEDKLAWARALLAIHDDRWPEDAHDW